MPGVKVSTATRSGPSAPLRAASGQFFVVGLAERGPTDRASLVRGIADFETIYGNRPSYGFLYDSVKTFFDEGGDQAYVARVVGDAATVGTITLKDTTPVTPADTLKFDAANAGAWSSNLSVIVADGALADTKRIQVLLGAEVVEDWNNIASPADAATKFTNSPYVAVTDLGSVTAAPDNLPANGTFTLTAGADDRAAVVAADYTAALDLFTESLGDGAVSIPGIGTTVHAGLVAHAKANRRIALLSAAQTAIVTDLQTAAGAVNADVAGLFAPWVLISDGAGGTRACPPEGYVAGVRNRAHTQVGPWRVPAGNIAIARSVIGLQTEFTKSESDTLDASRVSVIRRVANSVRLYGWRSLSSDESNYGYLSIRDLLNRLVVESELRLEDYVFSPIDGKGQLQSAINAEITGIVEPIRQAGGLFERLDAKGNLVDPGYLVETGNTVNSEASLANNEVRARLSVRPSPTAAMVSLTIVKVGLLAGL